MIRKYDAWICDLCGSEAMAERGHSPIGWRRVPIAMPEGAETQEERHICPFCMEALMQIEEDAKRIPAKTHQTHISTEAFHATVYPA